MDHLTGNGLDARGTPFGALSLQRTPLPARILPWFALVGWLLLSATAEYLRPGELLEFGLVGAAGVSAWALLRTLASRRLQLLAGLVFMLPLLNTWPSRALLAQLGDLGVVSYVLAPGSLLALLIVLVAPIQKSRRPPALPLLFVVLVTAAAVTSSFASGALDTVAGSAWVALLAPTAVGLVVAAAATEVRTGWTLVAVPAAAALVPAAMGLVAYVVSYGPPLSIDDLIVGKMLMARTGLVQEVTFGNVAHLAAFALLVGPPAAASAAARSLPVAVRACAGASAVLLACALLLSFSRAGFLVAALLLAVGAGLVGMRAWLKRRARLLAVAAALVAIAPPVAALAWSDLEAQPAGRSGGAGTSIPGGESSRLGEDASFDVRVDAVRRGLQIVEENRLGVGVGRYAEYDPVHKSPHSLFVRVLAETGVVGGVAFVVLLLMVCSSLRLFARTLPDDEWLLRLGCTLGAGGFLAYAVVAGAPLALGPVNPWSLLLAVFLGVQLSRLRAA